MTDQEINNLLEELKLLRIRVNLQLENLVRREKKIKEMQEKIEEYEKSYAPQKD